jgi:hypothetical protein
MIKEYDMKNGKGLVVLLIAIAFALGIGAALYAQNIQRGQKAAEPETSSQPYRLGGGCGGSGAGCGGGYNDDESLDYGRYGCH